MKKYLSDLDKPTDLQANIDIFRLFYFIAVGVQLGLSSRFLSQFEEGAYISPVGFNYFNFQLFGILGFDLLRFVLLLIFVLIAVGIGPRILSFVGLIVLYFYLSPFNELFKSVSLVPWTLMCFMIIPNQINFASKVSPKSWLTLKSEKWCREILVLIIGLSYLQAACSKIIGSGWGWFTGQTLREHLVRMYLMTDNVVSLWLIQNNWALILAAFATILFESSFIAVLAFSKRKYLFVVAGVLFHSAIFVSMQINFFYVFIFSYLIFVDWASLTKKYVLK